MLSMLPEKLLFVAFSAVKWHVVSFQARNSFFKIIFILEIAITSFLLPFLPSRASHVPLLARFFQTYCFYFQQIVVVRMSVLNAHLLVTSTLEHIPN